MPRLSRKTHFYDRVRDLLSEGRHFTIATLVEVIGSAPQSPGAKIIVFPDRSIEFTIGGGVVEAEIIQKASDLAESSGSSRIEKYYLEQLDMHCGGAMRVMYEVLDIGEKLLPFYEKICTLLDRRENFVIAHDLCGAEEGIHGPTSKMLILENGACEFLNETWGDLDEILRLSARLLSSGERVLRSNSENFEGNLREIFMEAINRPLRLLIYGAGHVGAKLAEVAAASGLFRIEIADDRADFAREDRLPFADQIYAVAADYLGEVPMPDERTYVAIMTRCHDTDLTILKQIFDHGVLPPYLGMIGSAPKRANLCHKLREEGYSEEQLSHIITPMGIPIGGRDPREIAISMLAEIIHVKNEHEKNLEGGTKSWDVKYRKVLSETSGS